MIFEVKKADQIFRIDDLKLFDQQSTEFKQMFNSLPLESGDNFIKVEFDNASAILFTHSNRLLINPTEHTNENN